MYLKVDVVIVRLRSPQTPAELSLSLAPKGVPLLA